MMTLKPMIKEFAAQLGNRESILDKNHKNIAEKIALHWGYPEFDDYIKSLLMIEKDRNRGGLPHEAMLEVQQLQELHEKIYPGMKSGSIKYCAIR